MVDALITLASREQRGAHAVVVRDEVVLGRVVQAVRVADPRTSSGLRDPRLMDATPCRGCPRQTTSPSRRETLTAPDLRKRGTAVRDRPLS
ncbi:hypothetical protein [Saccharopolyspora spinosa]|uniref:hypothetical protein n=1 Tax=Saccharopolyspora spinosa TaxID=60894 RepID=UPI0002FFAFBE|nr:hypothetical protein [Saccharopolyspora spinosa]